MENLKFSRCITVCFSLLLLAGCGEQDNSSGVREAGSLNKLIDNAWQDGWTLPGYLVKDSKDTFLSRTDNQIALGLAGGASIAMHQQTDEKIAVYFDRHDIFNNIADRGLNFIGYPGFHFACTGLWYAMSVNSDDDFNKDRAFTMMRALSLTGLTTMGLKAIRDNETPSGERWAWPSGHTSSSFAVASVLDEFYGPQVGISAYAAATLVGLRMMDQKDHWGSDVVFGAVLGWVIGHTVAGKHKQLEVAGFQVIPFMATNAPVTGLALYRQF